MRLRMQADVEARGAEHRGAHRCRRSLARRASDVDAAELALGVADQIEQGAHAIEPAGVAARRRLVGRGLKKTEGRGKIHRVYFSAECSPVWPVNKPIA